MPIAIPRKSQPIEEQIEEEEIDLAISTPLSEFTNTDGNYRINSQMSTWNENETGGAMGIHTYAFSGLKYKLDILGGSNPLTLTAGANVEIKDDGYEKNIEGNSWDSWFSSVESFDPSAQDFAVSWLVESTEGTIREMVGLDGAPSANASYSSIEYAIYQVNGTFYSYVYEKGRSIITGAGSVALNAGDRLGIKCIDGIITYYIQSGQLITDIYTSKTKATSPLYLKAALNRGDGSSGEAVVTNCKYHDSLTSGNVTARIAGLATEMISEMDKDALVDIGIYPADGTSYSDFNFTRPVTQKFPAGLSLNYSHYYSVNEAQDVNTVTM